MEGLHITAKQTFKDLQSVGSSSLYINAFLTMDSQDARTLEPIKKSVEELVPTLDKEYNEIMQELEREQAEVAEIEASDQDYLNDLKVSIAEQK